MKNITIEMKNPTYIYISNSRLEATEEEISELGRPKEIIKNLGQKDRRNTNYDRVLEIRNKARRYNIILIRVPKGDKREIRRSN